MKNKTKNFKSVILVFIMLLTVLTLLGCMQGNLSTYKEAAKAEIQMYADTKTTQNDYKAESYEAITEAVSNGKQAVNDAGNKKDVDAAVKNTKGNIDDIEMRDSMNFPSVLETFNLEEFTDEFFENNTLILVPFQWGFLIYEYLEFYTVYVENGKLNFLIEITFPYPIGEEGISYRPYAIIIPNDVFGKYEVGGLKTFYTFYFDYHNRFENHREILKEIEKNSIEHRVSKMIGYVPQITVISSTEALSAQNISFPSK